MNRNYIYHKINHEKNKEQHNTIILQIFLPNKPAFGTLFALNLWNYERQRLQERTEFESTFPVVLI